MSFAAVAAALVVTRLLATIAADRLGLAKPIGAAGFLVVTLAFGLALGAA